jgi:hypothetical protein
MILWLVLFAITSGVIGFQHQQPVSNLLERLGLDDCNGRLCFMGVIPGLTKWNKVPIIPFENRLNERQYDLHYTDFTVSLWASFNGDHTTQVSFRSAYSDMMFTLGELIAYFGTPCAVTLTTEATYLQYEQFFVEVAIPYENAVAASLYLEPKAHIVYFQLPPGGSCNEPLIFPSSTNIRTRWYGFRSLAYYAAQRIGP